MATQARGKGGEGGKEAQEGIKKPGGGEVVAEAVVAEADVRGTCHLDAWLRVALPLWVPSRRAAQRMTKEVHCEAQEGDCVSHVDR